MCVTEYLQQKMKTMAPGEKVVIDSEWIEWVISEHGCDCDRVDDSGHKSELGHSTADLSEMFGAAVSTVRTWCGLGVFGDPAVLKPNGKRWHVPPAAVAVFQDKIAIGYRITSAGFIAPRDEGDKATGTQRQQASATKAGHSPAKQKGAQQISSSPARNRYNDWREHLRQ